MSSILLCNGIGKHDQITGLPFCSLKAFSRFSFCLLLEEYNLRIQKLHKGAIIILYYCVTVPGSSVPHRILSVVLRFMAEVLYVEISCLVFFSCSTLVI